MKAAGKRKRTYETYHKTRLALFVRSYVGYSIANHLIIKYKIDDKQTKPQLHKQFSNKKAIPEISRLSKALNLNYQLLWQFVVLNKKQSLSRKISINEKIMAFLAVEAEMTFLTLVKRDKENIISEDYERAIFGPAIERTVGNCVRNINDDCVFEQKLEELQREYRQRYYEIAYKYKLPTPRILAFIIRLITFKCFCLTICI